MNEPKPSVRTEEDARIINAAVRAVNAECKGLQDLLSALGDGMGHVFADVVRLILSLQGRVILSGMGKSGHVARKIAATLASTGTPSFYVHPAEASHGDMGMITNKDAVLMISNSGETPELAPMIQYVRRRSIPLIAMTARANSALAKEADYTLLLPKSPEACSIGLAPTTSTTMQMALGDALAVTLAELKGLTKEEFHSFHPGGNLGALLQHLRDIMHTGKELPLAGPETPMREALLVMTGHRFGTLGIVDDKGRLIGIITDGDLRRAMEQNPDLLSRTAGEIMTKNPKTLPPDTLAVAALDFLNRNKITVVFVVDDADRPIGIVHVHDLLRLEGSGSA